MGLTAIFSILLLCIALQTASGHGEQFRERRAVSASGRSCKDKFDRIKSHSACLPKSSKVSKSGISESDKLLILNTHNDYRSKVAPAAANMLKMRWDDEIAVIAQGWAENCYYGHDGGSKRTIPGRFSVGQNLARGYKDWQAAIDAWYNEKNKFTFGTKSANVFEQTGHYTQMVWATSNRVGCAFADCSNARKYYVCNYGPAGNIGDFSIPYKTGASQCGQKYRKNKLCACGQDCLNGGEWNLSDCSCKCLNNLPFYIGNECNLDCSNASKTQPKYCGSGGFDASGCTKFENVPYHCPETCNICPTGGVKYQENSDKEGMSVCLSPSRALISGAVLVIWMLSFGVSLPPIVY